MSDEHDDSDSSGKKTALAIPATMGAGGGIALGAVGVAFISKLSADPAKAADWIVGHGAEGILFAIVVGLVFVVWRQAERIDVLVDKINKQDRRYAAKVEDLMGKLVHQSERVVKLITKVEVALRKLRLMEPEQDDEDVDGEDTRASGTTTPVRK